VRVKSSTFTGGGSEFSISICAHELMNSRATAQKKNAGRTGMSENIEPVADKCSNWVLAGKEETARQEFAKRTLGAIR